VAERNHIERTLREAYAARQRGDIDAILRLFTPDAQFTMAGSPQMSPVAMQVEGAEPFRAALQGMIKTFIVEGHEIVSILVDGDRAAVHWRAQIRSSVTGEVLRSELCDLVYFRGGRIASFHEFCDTAAAARLMGRA
jgi:ketosteroid isomerase-like protein